MRLCSSVPVLGGLLASFTSLIMVHAAEEDSKASGDGEGSYSIQGCRIYFSLHFLVFVPTLKVFSRVWFFVSKQVFKENINLNSKALNR